MAITDLDAVVFSNEHLRPGSDRIARGYRLTRDLKENWDALTGSISERVAVMKGDIQTVANYVSNAYFFIHRAIRLYDGLGMNALYPNDAGEILFDNSDQSAPDTNRPEISGADIRRAVLQFQDFLAWMEQNEYDRTSVAAVDYITLRSFLIVSENGGRNPTDGSFAAIPVTRAGEWETRFVTTSPNSLVFLDRVGVNTGA